MVRSSPSGPDKPQMTPERWKRVKELLETALERRTAERTAYLEGECRDDPELRRDVESLLAAEADLGDFIEAPVFDLHGTAEPPPEGVRLGSYRLRSEIGRGGMGRVYLAERDDETFEQRVAVKVLKRGLDTEEILARFHRERQILARLEHPNIARILDAGTTEDGLPYFVMEYVEGRPIDEYCDAEKLSVEARLRLFLAVCEAVRFAHQNLVVHRDLKPGNILVTADGMPKLLDFGIAKLLSPDQADAAETRAGWQFLTPEYASPEQLRGEVVTTASDVFSLGSLLVLLLTGRRPFVIADRSWVGVRNVLLKEEPRAPSALLTRSAPPPAAAGGGGPKAAFRASPEEIAAHRGLEPRTLRRRLRGDLDAIALKALERDSNRRYGSVEQLSTDVRRHLEGRPVSASRNTFVYRAGKLVRRYPFRVATAAAFVLLLIASSVVANVLQARAETQRDRAEREARLAEEVTGFLEDIFTNPDPRHARGEEITARQLLDQGRDKILRNTDDDPRLRGRLLVTMARSYRNLGLSSDALPLAEEALLLRRTSPEESPLEIAESLDLLASLKRLDDNPQEAERLLRQALALHEGTGGPPSEAHIAVLNNLAVALGERNALEEAELLHRRVLHLKLDLYGAEDQHTATTYHNLGNILLKEERLEDAEAMYRQALNLRRRELAAPDPDLAATLNSLAATLEARWKLDNADKAALDEAEALYREALAMRHKLFPDGHRDVAATLINLGLLLRNRGKPDEAEAVLTEAVELPESVLPPGKHRATALRSLNAVLLDLHDGPGAEAAIRKALALVPRRPQTTETVADYQSALGEALLLQGRFTDAEPLLTESFATLTALGATAKRNHLHEACRRLRDLYTAWGRPERAPECPA